MKQPYLLFLLIVICETATLRYVPKYQIQSYNYTNTTNFNRFCYYFNLFCNTL